MIMSGDDTTPLLPSTSDKVTARAILAHAREPSRPVARQAAEVETSQPANNQDCLPNQSRLDTTLAEMFRPLYQTAGYSTSRIPTLPPPPPKLHCAPAGGYLDIGTATGSEWNEESGKNDSRSEERAPSGGYCRANTD